MSSDCLPQFIRGEDGSLVKVFYRNDVSSSDNDCLAIEKRKFFLNSHAEMFKKKFLEVHVHMYIVLGEKHLGITLP